MKQVMDAKIAHHLLTENQPILEYHWLLLQSSPVYILAMTFNDMEYPFIQSGAALMATLPRSVLCTCSPAEHETLNKSLT